MSSQNETSNMVRRQFYGRDRKNSIPKSSSPIPPPIAVGKKDQQAPDKKLGTFSGVYIPTTLNVLSVLMFLRFGFIIGQAGILGTFVLILLSYSVDLLTTLSISAISTNGTVKGGGAYYMISRSLGPEFGGSIGVVFYIGQILNTGLNVAGFLEPLVSNFGSESGELAQVMPQGPMWFLGYCTILLSCCVLMCLVGSSLFAKSGNILIVILITSVLSIPLSVLIKGPSGGYTGVQWATFKQNFMPHFTKGAAGSRIHGRESFQDMFGILFPATSGIFAGASMSGDLRKPSKSIPKGTLWGLLTTFFLYTLVVLAIGSSVSREMLHTDIQVIQDVNISSYLVLMGELSTSLYSALMGVVGASKLLQAISRDSLLPFTSWFAKGDNNPINAILFTWALCQITLFFDINQIAVFITMAYLMTFVVTNLACFLLKIASAPNFRPSFRFFNSTTAGVGAFACMMAMFVADSNSASAMIIILALLFLLIHYISPPKPWGDVSQSLIYHQVRKYLLRLRQDHVKYWRPQILLLVDDPRTSWSLIHFCNHLKKGGLYILSHIISTKETGLFTELRHQQDAWNKLRTITGIKGFVQIATGPDVVWGARNVYLGSGLGNMRPNLIFLGFFEKKNHYSNARQRYESFGIDMEQLPTDGLRKEEPIKVTQWVNIIEDLVSLQANVAVAKGFPRLEFPEMQGIQQKQGFIDLYPIQMSAQITDENGEVTALSTNFDTYTLILQMGAILRTVPAWKRHRLRVVVFVEYQEHVENERARIATLLDKLRIKAEIVVACLSSKQNSAYETIIHNAPDSGKVERLIGDDEWWQELQAARADYEGDIPHKVAENLISMPETNKVQMPVGRARRLTLTSLQKLGVNLSMQTNKITPAEINEDGYYDDYHYDSETDYSQAPSIIVEDNNNVGFEEPLVKHTPPFHVNESTESLVSDASTQPDYFSAGYQYGRTAGGATPYPPAAPATTHKHHSRTPSGLSQTHNVEAQRPTMMRTVSGSNVSSSTMRPQYLRAVSGSQVPQVGNTSALRPPLVSRPSLMKTLSRSGSQADLNRAKKLKPNFSGLTMPDTKVSDDETNHRTIMFEQPPKSPRSPHAGTTTPPATKGSTLGNKGVSFDEQTPLLINRPAEYQAAESNTKADREEGEEEEEEEDDDNSLSFNDLPAKAQHIILNDLMSNTSRDAAVIFSTLPAPALGTCQSEQDSLDYVESLELWCEGLPPVVLLHSQSMTVTTAL